MTVFVTITRGGRSALVRETVTLAGVTGRPHEKYCGIFPIEPTVPDQVPGNVRRYLGEDKQKIATVNEWLRAHRDATEATRQRAVIDALKSAVLDTMTVLSDGATLSAVDRIEIQLVLLGLQEVVES